MRKELEDLTGKHFGLWTVIEFARYKPEAYWLCKCGCGKVKEVYGYNLKRGFTNSCGCIPTIVVNRPKTQKPRKDLVGCRFGRLVVVNFSHSKNSKHYWVCKCDCGNIITKFTAALTSKNHPDKSCGCWAKEKKVATLKEYFSDGKRSPKLIDYTGRRFGRLEVLKLLPQRTKNRTTWLVKCDCGEEKAVSRGALDSGRVNSCGCFRREDSRKKMLKLRPTQVGQNNPAWNPDITDEERKLRQKRLRSKEVTEWAKTIKIRDNFTCQLCNGGGRLNSHHLDSYRAHPDKRTDLTNGVTLCKTCHDAFHSAFGRKVTYADQYYEFRDYYAQTNSYMNSKSG